MTRLQELKMKYRDKYKEDVIIDLYAKIIDDEKYIKINKLNFITLLVAIACWLILTGTILMFCEYLKL